jgi:hypothetical protein
MVPILRAPIPHRGVPSTRSIRGHVIRADFHEVVLSLIYHSVRKTPAFRHGDMRTMAEGHQRSHPMAGGVDRKPLALAMLRPGSEQAYSCDTS